MAMLAERRGKQKYILTPRGKPLYEDESSFGAQMLKKMGWSKGKGLGLNEDGNQDFIRVSYKNDSAGIGFEDRDDGWTQHQTQFQDLLKSLNDSQENSQSEEKVMGGTIGFGFKQNNAVVEKPFPKLSGESLEAKSKKSKVRVHYKKFTKGKDLSQYSEKDLANILGKKSLKTNLEEKTQCFHKSEEKDRSKTKFGVDTINTGTSINDYFKNKLSLLKTKKIVNVETSFQNTEQASENVEECKESEISTGSKDKKREKHKHKICMDIENSNIVNELNQDAQLNGNKEEQVKKTPEHGSEIKKKKKSKRKRGDDEDGSDSKMKPKKEKSKSEEEYSTSADTNGTEKSQSGNPEIALSSSEDVNNRKVKSKNEKGTEAASKKVKTSEDLILEPDLVPETLPKMKKVKCKQPGTNMEDKLNEITSKNPLGTTVSNDKIVENNSNGNKMEIPASPKRQDQNSLEGSRVDVSENDAAADKCVYKINNFVAEIFRYTDSNGFPGANLGEIVGYSLSDNISVEVVPSPAAEQQLSNLWSYVIRKQEELKKNQSKSRKMNFRRFRKKQLFVVN